MMALKFGPRRDFLGSERDQVVTRDERISEADKSDRHVINTAILLGEAYTAI